MLKKQVTQIRFYQDGDHNNYPALLKEQGSKNLLYEVNKNIFNTYTPIIQLGIQALPGTKFYLNNNDIPIIIGNTGIYELDFNGEIEIASLRFDQNSINMISNNPNSYLIVDIIYEGKEDI